jgi:hypothetical protein
LREDKSFKSLNKNSGTISRYLLKKKNKKGIKHKFWKNKIGTVLWNLKLVKKEEDVRIE